MSPDGDVRSALEQALDRLRRVEAYRAEQTATLPACEAAIALAEKALRAEASGIDAEASFCDPNEREGAGSGAEKHPVEVLFDWLHREYREANPLAGEAVQRRARPLTAALTQFVAAEGPFAPHASARPVATGIDASASSCGPNKEGAIS